MIIRNPKNEYVYSWMFQYLESKVIFARLLKEKYGYKSFNFDWDDKCWRFSDFKAAMDIKAKFPDTKISIELGLEYSLAVQAIQDHEKQTEKALEIKAANHSDLKVENVKEGLYPYQVAAVDFMINCNGRMILSDQPGAGKSAEALAYIAHTKKKRTLVVCPASVKYSWENEVAKWTNLSCIVVSTTESTPEQIYRSTEEIIVINYDILGKYIKHLMKMNFSCLVGDESHYIKSKDSARTKYFKLLATQIPEVILMSGTPMLSRPVELYTSLNIIDPNTWNNYYSYTARYCDGKKDRFGWNVKGATNMEELQQNISRYFLRRTKDEILPFLPKKMFIDMPVELDGIAQAKYKMVYNEFETYLATVKKKDKKAIDRAMKAEMLLKLSELRQITSNGKMEAAKEIIENIIDSNGKLLVFSCYNKPLEDLHAIFGEQSVLLTGKTDTKERQAIIDQFQHDPYIKIFFGGTKSAGIGITLTAASTVLFIDYSWTPADHEQALDRIHRPGQEAEHVEIIQMYARGTIDEYMAKLLKRKQKIFDKIIEGKDVSSYANRSVQDDLIKIISKEKDIHNKEEST